VPSTVAHDNHWYVTVAAAGANVPAVRTHPTLTVPVIAPIAVIGVGTAVVAALVTESE